MSAPQSRRCQGRVITEVSLAALVMSTITLGCGTPQVTMTPEARSFTPADYEGVYKDWTRGADEFAFGRFADVLHVTATFQSWEQRWAYVVRYAHDHSLRTEARADMLRATLDDAAENHRFFVTLVGNNLRESDLTSARAAWRVLMVDERGNTTVPVEIEKVDRPDAATRTYFPSVSPHRIAFRVVFPVARADGSRTIPNNAEFILLRFTGAQGTIDLRWDFADG
ncbi:MAG: hypothetical protein AAGF12_07170 [Myxococcota bacterium]